MKTLLWLFLMGAVCAAAYIGWSALSWPRVADVRASQSPITIDELAAIIDPQGIVVEYWDEKEVVKIEWAKEETPVLKHMTATVEYFRMKPDDYKLCKGFAGNSVKEIIKRRDILRGKEEKK